MVSAPLKLEVKNFCLTATPRSTLFLDEKIGSLCQVLGWRWLVMVQNVAGSIHLSINPTVNEYLFESGTDKAAKGEGWAMPFMC